MPKFVDLTGQVFGRLKVVGRGVSSSAASHWVCLCSCNNHCVVGVASLKNGQTQSCGCYRYERVSEANLIDLTGQIFGRWTVIGRATGHKEAHWTCRCICKNFGVVSGSSLRRGGSTSCGCFHSEVSAEIHLRHGALIGGGRTSEYNSWASMITRCFDQNHPSYKNYGGRGIGIDDPRWLKFENFIGDMGKKPPGTTLERVDNNLGYSKENCIWGTHEVQSRNKRNNSWVTVQGNDLLLIDACEKYGVSLTNVRTRVSRYGTSHTKEFHALLDKKLSQSAGPIPVRPAVSTT